MSLPPSLGHNIRMPAVNFSRKGAQEFETLLSLDFGLLGVSLLWSYTLHHCFFLYLSILLTIMNTKCVLVLELETQRADFGTQSGSMLGEQNRQI